MKLYKGQCFTGVVLLALLAGCSSTAPISESSMQTASKSERLGTQWGDEVNSPVTSVNLRRTGERPIEQMQLYYADKNYSGRAINSMSLVAGKIDFSVATDRGNLSLYRDNGHYYVQGHAGQAYRLVYKNNSPNTYEVVASVDGLNVIDGSAASRYATGYVLAPNKQLVIEGFRKNKSAVASFIFSKPENAYAANTDSGSINNTGVIGAVIYQLYDPSRPRAQNLQAFPADNGYAKPPK
ncbi:hypothetical protein [Psychrobacter sp. BF1]|uniref:hypothetical protein n=1 Tax=Psychrobacter sp. BF1 TaxID=2821147 RepID=UPI001C4DDD95|nr:hypothetical protein [Psychrobacter sp. BF1]